jgi:hypothetical protein
MSDITSPWLLRILQNNGTMLLERNPIPLENVCHNRRERERERERKRIERVLFQTYYSSINRN